MKNFWIIVIIIIALVLLYLAYRYAFGDKSKLTKEELLNVVGPIKPKLSTPSGVLESDPLYNQNVNTDYTGSSRNLMTILQSLEYKIVVEQDGDVKALGDNSVGCDFIENFSKRFPGSNYNFPPGTNIELTCNNKRYKIDKRKWDDFNRLNLLNVYYNERDEQKAFDIYHKLVNFFGPEYFAQISNRTIQSEQENNDVYCNGRGYQQQLTLATAVFQQSKNDFLMAEINLNNYDNQENRDAFARTQSKYNVAENNYVELINKCKKS